MDTCRARPAASTWRTPVSPAVPRVVGDGYDGHGREVVTYIPGDFVHPHAWSDEGIWSRPSTARPPRRHRRLPASTRRRSGTAGPSTATHPTPPSVTATPDPGTSSPATASRSPKIDWSTAGPTDRLDEIAATAWLNAQLHDDDVAERQNLPDATARAAQLRHFLDGYQLATTDRRNFVTKMTSTPSGTALPKPSKPAWTPDQGDTTALWAIAWRARSAAWIMRHRHLLEHATTT